jgi:hypothetical protein
LKFGADILGIPIDGIDGTFGKGGTLGILIPDKLGKLGVDTLGIEGTLGKFGIDGIAGFGILGILGIEGFGILDAISAFLAIANFNPLDDSVGGPGNAGSISLNDLSLFIIFVQIVLQLGLLFLIYL